MKIEIFEIDFTCDGDLCAVTKGGNQIVIDDGERLFEKWCDRHKLSTIEREPESDDVDSMCIIYDKSPELMTEFALDNINRWRIERDDDGAFYGDPAEIAGIIK